MCMNLSRNNVRPKAGIHLDWHLPVFTLPGNLALDFKQMHPEGLMPGMVWYDLCPVFSHNPENVRPKRHIFSLFSICCELSGSQSYFSVNLNFSGPLTGVSSGFFPPLVCCTVRKFAGCGHGFLHSWSFLSQGGMQKIATWWPLFESKMTITWTTLISKKFIVLAKFMASVFDLYRTYGYKYIVSFFACIGVEWHHESYNWNIPISPKGNLSSGHQVSRRSSLWFLKEAIIF